MPITTQFPADKTLSELAKRVGMECVDLLTAPIDREVLPSFPTQVLFRVNAIPLERTSSGRIRVAIGDPFDLEGLNELQAFCAEPLDTVLAEPREIEARLHQMLGVGGGTISDLIRQTEVPGGAADVAVSGDDESEGSAASVIRFVNELLVEALRQKASDVHLEPQATRLEVRFRVDGHLRKQPIPEELHRFRSAIVSRLKIMARLNIAEKRLPQDGRINLVLQGSEIDIRLSVIPMLYGEAVVLRLLDQSRGVLNLNQLRFSEDLLAQWRREIGRPNGLVLVTGPTGSGKTTTLYASLAEVRSELNKIVTIEDPIEYHLEGINQIQVHHKVGLTFAAGLRSILRHDPDVVLIGEIRDSETAISAVQAALTGHLVLSTLHTNDAASAFTRLTDMGIEPYLVASTVNAVLAQRLVRRLCTECKVSVDSRELELPSDFPSLNQSLLYRPQGCRQCHGTGYSGRLAIYELLPSSRIIRKLAGQKADAMDIRRAALQLGMTSLRHSGWRQVALGETTVEEVLRVAVDQDEEGETAIDSKPLGGGR